MRARMTSSDVVVTTKIISKPQGFYNLLDLGCLTKVLFIGSRDSSCIARELAVIMQTDVTHSKSFKQSFK